MTAVHAREGYPGGVWRSRTTYTVGNPLLPRMLLTVGFLIGLLAMHGGFSPAAADSHSLAMASDSQAFSVTAPDTDPHSGHDVVHLCMTILAAAVAFGLAFLWLRDRTVDKAASARSRESLPPRAPPRRYALTLTSLCVLRT